MNGSDNDEDGGDDRQRLMRANPNDIAAADAASPMPGLPRRHTEFPSFSEPIPQPGTSGRSAFANDGVFANLNAKPERGEKTEEQPPVSIQFAFSSMTLILTASSPTNKLLLMQHLRTGRPR